MAKNKNYYVVVVAEAKLADGSKVTANGYVKLMPGCDATWLKNELSNKFTEFYNQKVNDCIITSLSQISKGLYNRLSNLED